MVPGGLGLLFPCNVCLVFILGLPEEFMLLGVKDSDSLYPKPEGEEEVLEDLPCTVVGLARLALAEEVDETLCSSVEFILWMEGG